MAGIENNIVFGGGFKLQPSSSRDISDMQRTSVDVSRINHTGSPEGVVAANPSSFSHDPVSGIVYVKQTGTGNTGWAALSSTTGTVTSVSGTTNRITSTGGTTPVIDISAAYVGQTSITTLGTVGTGTWQGTAVAATFGGTGQTTYTTGDLLYASASNVLSKLAIGSNTQVLTLAGGVPTWATPTTGTVTSVSGTANRITSTGGATPVIDISAAYVGQTSITTLGTVGTGTWQGTAVAATFGGTGQTTYTTGDLLYASASNVLSKLAVGSNTQVLTLAGGVPTWATPTTGTVTNVSGTTNRITSTGGATPVIDISAAYVGQTSITTLGTVGTGTWQGTAVAATFGGTGQTTYATGDILYASATNVLSKLTAGSNTQVLTLAGGVPTWATPASGTITTVNFTLTNAQIKALHATPIQLLPAPGASKAYIIVSQVGKLIYGGTNAFTAGGGASIDLYRGTTSFAGSILSNSNMVSTSTIYHYTGGISGDATAGGENAALNLYNASATEIAGNAANNNTVSGSFAYYIGSF